jgi:hypothetical protein
MWNRSVGKIEVVGVVGWMSGGGLFHVEPGGQGGGGYCGIGWWRRESERRWCGVLLCSWLGGAWRI